MPLAFLAGVRILDLSQYVPGPYAGLMLADLGADVVKLEPPAGDPMRGLGGRDADGLSAAWKLMNAGKTVIEVDLKSPAGADLFTRLLMQADVLLESYRPGVLARLGFARERLVAINPRLIHAALSGYGQTGPWRWRSGHDINYMAVAGGLAVTGATECPVMAMPPTADYASALQTALAISAALFGRAATGKGAFLDLSLAETVLGWQSITLTRAVREDGAPRRAGELLNGGAACYQIYRAGDGRFVTLGAIEEKFWANFCAALGRPQWIARQWEPMPQTSLIADVTALIATRPAAAWEELLAPIDCCFAVAVEPREVAAHPQIAARGMLAKRRHGTALVEALFPAHVDGQPPLPRRDPLFATAQEVLARWG